MKPQVARYTFRADDGDEFEVETSMEKAPKLGSIRRRNGKAYRRVLDICEFKISINPHFESLQFPRWSPYAKKHNPVTGRCQFSSWDDIRYAEKVSAEKDGVHAFKYD